MNGEFYIGWEANAAPGIRTTMFRMVVLLIILSILGSAGLAMFQRLIGTSAFEWGTRRTFNGILQAHPYPHLLVPRPGLVDGLSQYSSYYLVAPWKFGLDPAAVAKLSGKTVSLDGTLIYRGNQTMIETRPEWVHPSMNQSEIAVPRNISLGRQTLRGEIVDSKCFLGVMNPGQLTPHRACAIRCISGGIPPVLLVRQKNRPALYLLLVAPDGQPINKRVLDLVAEPVEITGEVERQGDLLILRADPATYRRAP